MNEFKLIEKIISQLGEASESSNVEIGPGDDAAVVSIPTGEQLVVSTDSMVVDVHFPKRASADLIGYRTVAASVSDLAAMGAHPIGATVALTIEEVDVDWVERFVGGVRSASEEYDLPVIGGNLARGSLNIVTTVQGRVAAGQALRRAGSQTGDDIWVTGTLGATRCFLNEPNQNMQDLATLRPLRDSSGYARYFLPHARVQFASTIAQFVHACIDVSDGLASELEHLSRASQRGMRVDLSKVPVWEGLDVCDVAGGDDSYELLFTTPPAVRSNVLECAFQTATPVVVIGEVTAQGAVELRLDGETLTADGGFDHFK